MMLNTSKWKEFNLDKLFDISAGIYHYSDEYDIGDTPYISASNENNGIQQRINLEPEFSGNCIVAGKVGCTTFYQSEDFCATSDVNIFKPKNFELTRKIGLFITAIINFSENYKWNYGRQCRVGDSKKVKIKLPTKMKQDEYVIDPEKKFSEEGYIPDFNFIDEFMENIENGERESSIRNSLNTKNLIADSFENVNVSNWGEFELGEIFEKIYKAKPYIKGELETIDYPKNGYIPFITRTENNNATDAYVSLSDIDFYEKGNAIIIGDTTSTTFYQKKIFATGDHIVVCRAEWLNEYNALYIKSIIDKNRYRYNYGRAFKMDLIKKTTVKLPQNSQGNPDFKYMESYIKRLPYADRL